MEFWRSIGSDYPELKGFRSGIIRMRTVRYPVSVSHRNTGHLRLPLANPRVTVLPGVTTPVKTNCDTTVPSPDYASVILRESGQKMIKYSSSSHKERETRASVAGSCDLRDSTEDPFFRSRMAGQVTLPLHAIPLRVARRIRNRFDDPLDPSRRPLNRRQQRKRIRIGGGFRLRFTPPI